jgi:hypothetical protein
MLDLIPIIIGILCILAIIFKYLSDYYLIKRDDPYTSYLYITLGFYSVTIAVSVFVGFLFL